MKRHGIPTAAFRTFASSQYEEALHYVKTCNHKVVLKASGLAAGKGVLIPETIEETEQGLKDILVENIFGEAGKLGLAKGVTIIDSVKAVKWW